MTKSIFYSQRLLINFRQLSKKDYLFVLDLITALRYNQQAKYKQILKTKHRIDFLEDVSHFFKYKLQGVLKELELFVRKNLFDLYLLSWQKMFCLENGLPII